VKASNSTEAYKYMTHKPEKLPKNGCASTIFMEKTSKTAALAEKAVISTH